MEERELPPFVHDSRQHNHFGASEQSVHFMMPGLASYGEGARTANASDVDSQASASSSALSPKLLNGDSSTDVGMGLPTNDHRRIEIPLGMKEVVALIARGSLPPRKLTNRVSEGLGIKSIACFHAIPCNRPPNVVGIVQRVVSVAEAPDDPMRKTCVLMLRDLGCFAHRLFPLVCLLCSALRIQ